jgi:hypothetical protein
MRAPILRALRLLVAFLALVAIALVANRWHASRALDAARARSEALGLRFDPAGLASEVPPEARAALLTADELCAAIGDRAWARYGAEANPGEHDDERIAALTGEEALKDGEALEAAATRFLAAGAMEEPGALWRELESADSEDPGARVNPGLVRSTLVDHLCGAAEAAIAGGETERSWRSIELAARLSATQRGTHMTGVSWLGMMLPRLRAADTAGVAAVPGHAARERVRAALRDLDVLHEARAALRCDASVLLTLVEFAAAFGVTHRLRLRLVAVDLRDKAMLHRTWADIVAGSELPTPAEQHAALAAVDARMEELPRTYALTLLTVPRALSFWERAQKSEADRTAMLAE